MVSANRAPAFFIAAAKRWLHFHEDKAGLFADIRADREWARFRVSEAKERAELLSEIERSL